jgi:UPF0176 protein
MDHLEYIILLFYKYVPLTNPEKFRNLIYQFCNNNNLKGRVFIAAEGINGTVSGGVTDIENYKKHLRSFEEFNDILFKEDKSNKHAFSKLHVRVKNEIVSSGLSGIIPGSNTKRMTPEELYDLYKSGEDFLIVDSRNYYESNIGKFKNAIIPDIESFREWPAAVEQLKNYKDKKIVTYCTGGIRCEKASAYMVKQGFKDVYQLEGGIINYTKKFPDTFWEGSIFVFDERRSVVVNTTTGLKHIAKCFFCGTPTSYYINCHNQDCDKIIISCHKCKIENEYCCSEECRNAPNKRKRIHG